MYSLKTVNDRKTFDTRMLSPHRTPLTINNFFENKKKLNSYQRNMVNGEGGKNQKQALSKQNSKLNYKQSNNDKKLSEFTCQKFENFSQKLHAASCASDINKSSMIDSDTEKRKGTVDCEEYYRQGHMKSLQELPTPVLSNNHSDYESKSKKNIPDNQSKPLSKNAFSEMYTDNDILYDSSDEFPTDGLSTITGSKRNNAKTATKSKLSKCNSTHDRLSLKKNISGAYSTNSKAKNTTINRH